MTHNSIYSQAPVERKTIIFLSSVRESVDACVHATRTLTVRVNQFARIMCGYVKIHFNEQCPSVHGDRFGTQFSWHVCVCAQAWQAATRCQLCASPHNVYLLNSHACTRARARAQPMQLQTDAGGKTNFYLAIKFISSLRSRTSASVFVKGAYFVRTCTCV